MFSQNITVHYMPIDTRYLEYEILKKNSEPKKEEKRLLRSQAKSGEFR